jgi:glycolate oxidase FAD binding subunit
MVPSLLEPGDAPSAAEALARASAERVRVLPSGGRTKLQWAGTFESADPHASALSTRRLTTPLQHYAGDLVATLPAGVTLAEANACLASEGQWLPLDPPHGDRSTIGGIVASNASGPRRHKHGAPRDLIIGIEVALADGRLARAGGRVVKNVAGYDLSRLFCGSFGSLGVITSATFKLSPLPPASRTVIARAETPTRALELASRIAVAPLTPSALEVEAPAGKLLVRFETTERAADRMAVAARTVLDEGGATTDIVNGAAEQTAWREHDEMIWNRRGSVAKISVLPTDVAGLLDVLSGDAGGTDWSLAGRAALGVVLVRLDGDAERIVSLMVRLRAAIGTRGHITVLQGSADLRARTGQAMPDVGRQLMLAVKQRFDPDGILPPVPGLL